MRQAEKRKQAPAEATITKEIEDLLGYAVKKRGFQLETPVRGLAADEVLVVVIGQGSGVVEKRRFHLRSRAHMAASDLESVQEKMARRLAEIDVTAEALEATLDQPRIQPSSLTQDEEALLKEGGFSSDALRAEASDPVARAEAEFAELMAFAYDVEDVANLLGVNESRVRQRLSSDAPTLYGIKSERQWHLPQFQFHRKKLVPGIEKVIASLPGDLDPISVYHWFTTPEPDLEIEGGRAVSPLEWLKMGRNPGFVSELAEDL